MHILRKKGKDSFILFLTLNKADNNKKSFVKISKWFVASHLKVLSLFSFSMYIRFLSYFAQNNGPIIAQNSVAFRDKYSYSTNLFNALYNSLHIQKNLAVIG